MRTVTSTYLLFVFAAFPALAGCSGGGATSSPQAVSGTPLSSGSLVLSIPAPASATDAAHRFFLSPSALSVSVSVTGIAQTVVADVSATSPDCTTAAGKRSCAIPLAAPTGSDTFTATLYAGANAGGSILGVGTTTQSISNGAPFSLTVAVHGTAATIALSAKQTQFTEGVASSTTLSVAAIDAGGNTISGTYESPITLSDSDTTGTFTVSPKTVTSSGTTVTLSYSGGTASSSATIAANGTNVPVSTLSTQVVTVVPPAAFTLSPSTLTLLGTGVTAPVTISDPSAYAGAYSVSVADPTVATATASGKTIVVKAVGVGSTTATVSDTLGRSATISITVTTTALPIQ